MVALQLAIVFATLFLCQDSTEIYRLQADQLIASNKLADSEKITPLTDKELEILIKKNL